MLRTTVVALVGLLVAGSAVAAASSLSVTNDTVGQTFTFDVAPAPAPTPTTNLLVVVRRYAPDRDAPTGNHEVGPYTLPEGATYHVGYEGATHPCPADVTAPQQQLGGPFAVSDDGIHVLCVQDDDASGMVVTVRVGDHERETVLPDGAVPGSSATQVTGERPAEEPTDDPTEPALEPGASRDEPDDEPGDDPGDDPGPDAGSPDAPAPEPSAPRSRPRVEDDPADHHVPDPDAGAASDATVLRDGPAPAVPDEERDGAVDEPAADPPSGRVPPEVAVPPASTPELGDGRPSGGSEGAAERRPGPRPRRGR